MRLLTASSLLLLLCATTARPAPPPRAVLVELFTSQGCSSCPPADALLHKLGEDASLNLIPLAFHVDYWDHLGWRDPFSSGDWSRRQSAYSSQFRLNSVYTPQLVIDGTREVVGSNESAIRQSLREAAQRPAAASIVIGDVVRDATGVTLHFTAQAQSALSEGAYVNVALVQNGLATDVVRGENGGRKLRSDYVVRELQHAATLSGATRGSAHFKLDSAMKGVSVVVFVQNVKNLQVYAAAMRAL